MKSRSRRSSSKPPERARGPADGAVQKRRTTVQPYSSAGSAPVRKHGWAPPPFCEKHALSRIRRAGKRKCKNPSKAVFRPYPADRPLESGAAEKRARPPIRPACAGLPRTKAHGFSAVLTISRKAGRLSGGTVLLLPLSGGPSASGRICARLNRATLHRFAMRAAPNNRNKY